VEAREDFRAGLPISNHPAAESLLLGWRLGLRGPLRSCVVLCGPVYSSNCPVLYVLHPSPHAGQRAVSCICRRFLSGAMCFISVWLQRSAVSRLARDRDLLFSRYGLAHNLHLSALDSILLITNRERTPEKKRNGHETLLACLSSRHRISHSLLFIDDRCGGWPCPAQPC
jgi:hypothetical protein